MIDRLPGRPGFAPTGLAAGQAASARPGATAREPLPAMVKLYLFAVVIPIGFNAGPLAMTSLRLLLLVVTVPLMVRILMGHYGRLRITDILFPLHLLWAAVALFVNNPDRMVEQIGSVGIEFLGGYAVARAYIRTPGAFLALCRAMVWIVCLLVPLVVMEMMTGRALILEALGKIPGVSIPTFGRMDPRLGFERVRMSFAHPIHWGLFASVAFSLCFVGLKGHLRDGTRWLLGSVLAFCCFSALSSGALLAIFLQLGLIVWYSALARQEWRWWALIALGALAYVVVDLLSNRTPLMVFLSYATFSSHTAYWRSIIFDYGLANLLGSATLGIEGSPLFGIGLNDWIRPSWMHSSSIDNFWLLTAVRYGVPGVLLLALGYVGIIARVIRRDFRSDLDLMQFRRAWVFTMLGLTFTLITVHVWGSIYSFVFFLFGTGIWMIDARPGDHHAAEPSSPEPTRTPRYTRFPVEARPVRQDGRQPA